jgi:hypothetical protein
MKTCKLLGLVLMTGMAFIAVSAGPASADVLCKTAPTAAGECPTTGGNEDYPANTVFTAKASDPILTVTGSSVGVTQVTCTESNVTLESTGTGSNTPGVAVPGTVTSLQFGGMCTTTPFGFTCIVSKTSGYKVTVTALNNKGTGTLTATGPGIKTLVNCAAGFFKCEYEAPAAGVDLHVNPGNPATVVASGQPLTTLPGGTGCGTSATWHAGYTLNGTNTALWVATKNA